MKITEEYPLTVPRLCQDSGYHPELVKKLMPAADHHSGTTPRWLSSRQLPDWRAAVILPPREKMPVVKAMAEILPADLPNVIVWLGDMETAITIRQDYVKAFWTTRAGGEREWIRNRAKELGGVLTE